MTLMTMTDKERLDLLKEIARELTLNAESCTDQDILDELDEVTWKARNYDD